AGGPGGAESSAAPVAPNKDVDLTAEAEGARAEGGGRPGGGERDDAAADRQPALGSPTPPEQPAEATGLSRDNRPAPSKAATPIGELPRRGKATVEGRVHAVEIRPVERNTVLACEIVDATGQLTALFYGRSHIPGLDPGAMVRFTGQVGIRGDD